MQYDQNELALFQDELMREGKTAEGIEVRQKFIDAVRESGLYASWRLLCMCAGSPSPQRTPSAVHVGSGK